MTNQVDANFLALLEGDQEKLKAHKKTHDKEFHHDFVAFIDKYISSHGLIREFIISKANLTNYGYRILNGTKHTKNRNIILRICIAMKMNLEDTQEALKCYDMRLLDKEFYRDKIIMTGIAAHKDALDIEAWLCKAGEVSLYV